MSGCSHPSSSLYVDKARGTTVCTLCGEAITNEQFEMDPVFARGEQPAGGKGGMRGQGGGIRPMHRLAPTGARTTARPTLDNARRGMNTIARELEISDDLVEMALGMYKVAANIGAVSGTRPTVLCACLYAVCRREHTSHVIYDFAKCSGEQPNAILAQMKRICQATHTELPIVDPSTLVLRFAEQMNLGERISDVVVCALKVLRVMEREWIAYGRRPMGVCAAALLVACYMLGIPRTAEQVCGLVRLTAHTIMTRLREFMNTTAAELSNIDEYRPADTGASLPPSFDSTSRVSIEEASQASLRELSAIYYELVAEARASTPATPERCEKWRDFFKRHCEREGVEPNERSLQLELLTPKQQLEMLGLRTAEPIPYQRVQACKKEEEERIAIKHEQESQVYSQKHEPGDAYAAYPFKREPSSLSFPGGSNGVGSPGSDYLGGGSAGIMQDPESLRAAQEQFRELLHSNDDIRTLGDEFDFTDDGLLMPAGANDRGDGSAAAAAAGGASKGDATGGGERTLDAQQEQALHDALYDENRRHALPWEIIVLPEASEPAPDLLPYLILDNEVRLQRRRVGERLYGAAWARGRARRPDEMERLEDARQYKRRRLAPPTPEDPQAALERALGGRGTRSINVGNIGHLLPGLAEPAEVEEPDDWDDL